MDALKKYLEKKPTLHEFITPIYGAYEYSGGWGGDFYRNIFEYTLCRLSGVQRVLDFKNMHGTTFVMEWSVIDVERRYIALLGFSKHENYAFRQKPVSAEERVKILAHG